MKNLITLGIVTVVVVGIIGLAAQFLDWSKIGNLRASGSDILRQVQTESASEAVGNPSLAADPLYRDWSMLTDDEYRISLRYPIELTASTSGAQVLSEPSSRMLFRLLQPGTTNSRGVAITVQVQPAGEKTLDQFASDFNGGKVLLKQEMTVDGIRALRFWVQSPLEENDRLQEDYLLVKKGNDIFTFSSVGDENRALFEKIIKTVTWSF